MRGLSRLLTFTLVTAFAGVCAIGALNPVAAQKADNAATSSGLQIKDIQVGTGSSPQRRQAHAHHSAGTRLWRPRRWRRPHSTQCHADVRGRVAASERVIRADPCTAHLIRHEGSLLRVRTIGSCCKDHHMLTLPRPPARTVSSVFTLPLLMAVASLR
jgi:hypothetical protein